MMAKDLHEYEITFFSTPWYDLGNQVIRDLQEVATKSNAPKNRSRTDKSWLSWKLTSGTQCHEGLVQMMSLGKRDDFQVPC